MWRPLGKLKEQWGVSMQALLYRARRMGRLGDVLYRNAMTTISTRGWRRDEPGLVSAIEQPSLLPRAVELLAQEGVDERHLIEQCRVPVELFRAVTSRTPDSTIPELSSRTLTAASTAAARSCRCRRDGRYSTPPDSRHGHR